MKPIPVISAGAFGLAVQRRLAHHWPVRSLSVTSPSGDLEDAIDGAPFVAVALWRPYVALCETLDDICHRLGVSWSLAEVHGQILTCGPLVVPGHGACYHCYRQRYLSHHRAPDRELVLQDAYARSPEVGPAGFVGPMVEIAVASLLADSTAGKTRAGKLRSVDVLTGAVLETEVIGIHGCARCRADGARPGHRFVDHLIPAVEGLLQ